MPTNVQTTTQLCFFYMLSKVVHKILQVRLQQYVNKEFPDVQLDLENAEESEIKLPAFNDHGESKRDPKNLLLLHLLC